MYYSVILRGYHDSILVEKLRCKHISDFFVGFYNDWRLIYNLQTQMMLKCLYSVVKFYYHSI